LTFTAEPQHSDKHSDISDPDVLTFTAEPQDFGAFTQKSGLDTTETNAETCMDQSKHSDTSDLSYLEFIAEPQDFPDFKANSQHSDKHSVGSELDVLTFKAEPQDSNIANHIATEEHPTLKSSNNKDSDNMITTGHDATIDDEV